jgi:hypothetical protein
MLAHAENTEFYLQQHRWREQINLELQVNLGTEKCITEK